jgi:hypothetical protein
VQKSEVVMAPPLVAGGVGRGQGLHNPARRPSDSEGLFQDVLKKSLVYSQKYTPGKQVKGATQIKVKDFHSLNFDFTDKYKY